MPPASIDLEVLNDLGRGPEISFGISQQILFSTIESNHASIQDVKGD